MTIGSFRDATDFKDLLPQPVKEILFGNVETLSTEFDLNEKLVNLNHAAFGLPYKVLVELGSHLRSLADQDSALFYDKLICPLIRYSLTTAKEFFSSPHVVFTPNLTIGMKNLLESLLSHDESRRTIAILEPIYGATRKLVHNFLPNKRYRDLKVISIKPGLFIEDSNEIIGALEAQFSQEAFSYLIADHVTSQSGRILPLDDIIVWCKEKSVILIVDGTQSAELKLPQYPPYYILSTHKWLCNLRTCGVLRIEPGFTVPEPAGISFGYGEDETSEHLWTGMQDYIPQVTLSVALRIYEKHGKNILQRSSNLLQTEVNKIGVPVVLPYAKNTMRMINLVKVNRFDNVAFERLQDALDMRDLRVSVKNFENQEYLRISVFSYTTEKDFKALSEVLNYKLNYQSLTKEKLMQEFLTICAAYETLFDPLEEDGFFVRAEPLRHHLIFYYGHTSVFYINKLVLRGYLQNSERLDRLVESSCAVGVDEMSWDDLNEDNYPWTEESQRKIFVPKIRNYGEKVRELICKLIGNFDFSKKKKLDQLDMPWLILMGIEHCRIHIETSACIIHQLQPKYLNLSNVSKQFSLCPHRRKNPTDVPSNILVPVCGGSVQLGRSDSDRPNIFGWDNEFGNEEATLQDFEVSQMIVSNAEFLEFINDGGYTTREYWTDESWSWVTGMKRTAPLSWRNNNTMLRTLYEEIPMPWDWPVEVNSYEADAFCLWKSKQLNRNIRLISHEEWFLLRTRLQGNNYNINMKHWGSACPVDMFGEPANNKADILYDITGNVWQHSCSVLTLLQKGFKTHPAYDDFTTPTIDGKHYFLLGGSWISCGNPSTIHARYGFRKHFQQFAGIRYVASSNEYHSTIQPYYMGREDCLPITDQYLEFTNETFLEEKPKPNWYRWFGEFAASCVESENSNALDVIMINGSVGRTTLEFIRACKNSSKGLSSVMHTDLTATRLRVLESLNKCGMIRWDRFVEGDLVENLYFSLEENNLIIPEDIAISFRQLDTNNIDPKFCNRDVAVVDGDASNFTSIDRITPALVKPGGILVLASIAEVKQIPGYEFLKSDSAWKISSDTIRKYRVVKLHVSAWRRTEVSVGDIPAAADVPVSGRDENVYYESLGVVQSYEKFHFGPGYLGVPNFSKAVAEFAIKVSQECKISLHRALDVGSGPGRTAIELAQVFEDVTAIDFSASFIEMCKNNAPAYPLPQGHQLHAVVGDAHGLITEEKYDLVVAINLIDRLSEPKIFLDGIKPLLADNGLLIVASPFTWLEEFTSKSKWLGGYQKWGETHKSIDGLKEILSPEFKLIGEPQDIPFVIPDPDGSFQYCLSNTSVFGRV